MPSFNSGDVFRFSVRLSLPSGQDHVNVYYFEAQGTGTALDQDFADDAIAFFDTLYSRFNSALSNAMDAVDIKIDKVDFVGGELVITENVGLFPFTTSGFVPGNSGDVLPPQDAAVIKLLTGIGKSYGRKFLGGLGENTQNNGVPESTLITQAASFISDMLAGWQIASTTDMEAGIMSTAVDAFVKFISGELSSVLGGQRRRRLGSGS